MCLCVCLCVPAGCVHCVHREVLGVVTLSSLTYKIVHGLAKLTDPITKVSCRQFQRVQMCNYVVTLLPSPVNYMYFPYSFLLYLDLGTV